MADGLEGNRTPVRNTLLDSSTCLAYFWDKAPKRLNKQTVSKPNLRNV